MPSDVPPFDLEDYRRYACSGEPHCFVKGFDPFIDHHGDRVFLFLVDYVEDLFTVRYPGELGKADEWLDETFFDCRNKHGYRMVSVEPSFKMGSVYRRMDRLASCRVDIDTKDYVRVLKDFWEDRPSSDWETGHHMGQRILRNTAEAVFATKGLTGFMEGLGSSCVLLPQASELALKHAKIWWD